MRRFGLSWAKMASIALVLLLLGGMASAATVSVRFWSQEGLVLVERAVPTGMAPAEAAVRALVAGPTPQEAASGLTSRIPAETSIVGLTISDTSAAIDLSGEVRAGLNEAILLDIFDQFRTTLGDFPSILAIKLTCAGKPLSAYLPSPPQVGQPAAINPISINSVGLGGKKICIGPSHGRFWNGSGWYWQRSLTCGWGEAILEDTNSIRLVQFLKQYLTQDGATFTCPRQLDESDCCNADTGYPWWKMCSQSWLNHLGLPSSIWANYTGVGGGDTAADRSSDDVRARPLFADYQGSDIYIACHTNAGGAGAATGTETYRDTQMEHPEYVAGSLNLANAVHNSVIDTIRSTFPEEPSWANRGVKDSAAGFGEIRVPSRPAILIELAFHDDCTRDALYLTDDFFRSLCEWGIYNGICSYFGNTPTWDKYSCEYVSDTIPTVMNPGQSYSVTVTLRNRGVCWFTSRGFRLGVPSGTDPFGAFNRVDIIGETKPGQTYTFNYIMTAPTTAGYYTTHWQMVRDGYAWFGPTVSKTIEVGSGPIEPPDNTGSALAAKTVDWQAGLPTYMSGGWTSTAVCGYTEYYTYTENSACTNFNREAKWQSGQSFSGRGHWTTDVQIPCNYGTVNTLYRVLKADGTDEGTNVWMDQCPRDGWYNLLDADKQDLSIGGWRIHTADTTAAVSGGCTTACGTRVLGAAGLHMYGDRWQYINDWTCFGPFATANPGAIADNPASLNEANLYLYPAVDTTHGNVLSFGGVAPGHVTTGDCNNANSLNFAAGGNAAAYGGGEYRNSYGFAWLYTPTGAAPKFDIGSDDGNRVWVNGTLINDNNAFRGLGRDSDVTGSVSLTAGWNRVLFKIHNGAAGFEGTMSLRNGSNNSWNETSVNTFDLGGYLSYGLGYEQDSWYPRIDVAGFDGLANPQPADKVYTNSTTVIANGTATISGPVPLWKVMHFESGYGITGDTNYADVTSTGATWSHSQTGVTGHRRFSFFSVSQSHRTSFQSGLGSGVNGGSNWADGGPGNYADVYVDNVAPQTPSLSTLTAQSTSSINLDWALPLDQGVGVGPGADEYASTGGDNAYRRADVGVSVRRNASGIYGWGSSTSFTDTGLTANTQYSYDIAARDNSSQSRGAWNNATAYGGTTTRWTLSTAPSIANVTCDRPVNVQQPTAGFTFTAVGGFGAGTLDHYLYAWDKNTAHTFTGSESSWNSGTLPLTATSGGDWYLHVEGVNGEAAANGTLDLGPYQYAAPPVKDTIALAFAEPDSEPLTLQSKPVTASLPGMFWLEEHDRFAAIKVVSATSVAAGHLATVTGSLGVSGTQRVLTASNVDDLGLALDQIPAPVFTTIRSLGGADFNPSTPGVTNCKGLYNIGLLVRIAGNVTFFSTSDPAAKFFYVSDGSGATDDSGHSGVKVLCRGIDPPVTGMVIVTGVVSSEQAGASVVPRLIIRNSDDIQP
jgi:N-acetylmuramoyl-L-alanine amidase